MAIILQRKTLMTCHVLYWRPGYTRLLQEFTWQFEDVTPQIPRTRKFIRYWHDHIEAIIAEVMLCESGGEMRVVDYAKLLKESNSSSD